MKGGIHVESGGGSVSSVVRIGRVCVIRGGLGQGIEVVGADVVVGCLGNADSILKERLWLGD